ncbi:hypothetical protein ABTX62_20945 [Streptomyces sp. NPDC096046]|uniref:hypothetical protein n=1 Tax=Streptomyces sp. NPDC096046 TaxID=3155542 RepID=UPI00332D21E7
MGMVTFVDETTAGERRTAWGLEIAEERLTARELIRRRVFQEVAGVQRPQTGDLPGPRTAGGRRTPAERVRGAHAPRGIAPERQTALAER